ncbi:hypothetical protein [Helicobacter saguini]|uniref:hypothetical protein n=1 Tax=Helicobacter saguini TaxID=1548018 RepID=UPI001927D946|nr:hypothetical protein [Helicobacter saguini]
MITLKRYDMSNTAHKVAWNAFNAGAKNGIFMFDRDFMDYHSHRFKDNSLMFYENEKLIALLPLNLKIVSKSNNIESSMSKNETFIESKNVTNSNNIESNMYKNVTQNLNNLKDSKLSKDITLQGEKLQNLDSKDSINSKENSQDSQNLDSKRNLAQESQKTTKILYSHEGLSFGGFIIDSNMRQAKMLECFTLLKEYMFSQNIDKLVYKALPYIYHKSPADEDIYALFRNDARVFRVDCSSVIGLDSKFKMNELRKRCVKKAIKNDIKIIESNDFPNFVNLLNDVLQTRHNTNAVHNASELSLLKSRFERNIRLFIATFGNTMIAATLLFEYEKMVHTQYLCANAVGRELGGLDLLLKTLIDSYLGSKMYFDFGISNENNGLFLNEGLIAQKESFGGRTIAYNTFEMLVSNTYGGGVKPFFYYLFLFFLLQKVINFIILSYKKLHFIEYIQFTQGEKYDYPA